MVNVGVAGFNNTIRVEDTETALMLHGTDTSEKLQLHDPSREGRTAFSGLRHDYGAMTLGGNAITFWGR